MFRFKRSTDASELLRSRLHSEQTFYAEFMSDLKMARRSVVIESPFITKRRFDLLYPALHSATERGANVIVNTRDPAFHSEPMRSQAADCITTLHELGVTVLYTGNLHRKLAMIDGKILWDGSLNILSQNDSCEVMRRTISAELVRQMVRFTRLGRWYNV